MPKLTQYNFQRLILAYVALIILFIIGMEVDAMYFEQLLPSEYLGNDAELLWYYPLIGLVSIIIGIWRLQNLYAMYRFKSYAPRHFLIITLIPFSFFFLEPVTVSVTSAWSAVFGSALLMLDGLILALAFFSPLSKQFKSE